MVNITSSVRSRLAKRSAYLKTLSELNALSDAEAADLGMFRHDFERIARQAVYGI